MKKILLMLVTLTILGGCASGGDKDEQLTKDWQIEKLYTEAKDELNSKNYNRAIKLYSILMARYPYGKFAQQAQLDTAYAYFKDDEQVKALEELHRFEQQHPRHQDMDYVLYLKGLVLFNEDRSFGNKLAAQDWSDRDSQANRDAFEIFNQLVTEYPSSKYTLDATKRMSKIIVALAGHEMSVARYYMKRGAYLAAVNRSQNILRDFRNTEYLEEALALMMSAYDQMGQKSLSQDTRRILQANFPESRYLAKGWKDDSEIPWWRYWK